MIEFWIAFWAGNGKYPWKKDDLCFVQRVEPKGKDDLSLYNWRKIYRPLGGKAVHEVVEQVSIEYDPEEAEDEIGRKYIAAKWALPESEKQSVSVSAIKGVNKADRERASKARSVKRGT